MTPEAICTGCGKGLTVQELEANVCKAPDGTRRCKFVPAGERFEDGKRGGKR